MTQNVSTHSDIQMVRIQNAALHICHTLHRQHQTGSCSCLRWGHILLTGIL